MKTSKSITPDIKVTMDIDKLLAIQKELGQNYVTRVGILGDKASRMNIEKTESGSRVAGSSQSAMTNAEVGTIQEFGSYTKRIPMRSFLRMPLELKLPGVLNKIGQSVINGLTKNNIRVTFQNLGIMSEKIIQGAFASKGYGRWPENAPATVARKKSSMPLIDTAQLRASITSKVILKGA